MEDEFLVVDEPIKEKIYTITLADGTIIKNLRLNGNNYISLTPVFKSTFEYNLSTVVISDGETETTYHNMDLVQVVPMPHNEYWFILRELSDKEIADAKLRADVDYIAMMADVEM